MRKNRLKDHLGKNNQKKLEKFKKTVDVSDFCVIIINVCMCESCT